MDDRPVRAQRHAALGDPARLAVIDALATSDMAPSELRRLLDIESNLLAHHLDVLESVGFVARTKSSGDGRRRYVHLNRAALASLVPGAAAGPQRALFVCTRNSARSQLAAALWRSLTGAAAESAGTHPSREVHPGAVAAAERAGLDLRRARPRSLGDLGGLPPMVVTVCDQAHEELQPAPTWWHWSVPDPVADGRRVAFDRTVVDLRDRIMAMVVAR